MMIFTPAAICTESPRWGLSMCQKGSQPVSAGRLLLPPGWDPDSPTAAHRATAYGELHGFLGVESDPDRAGSLAALMLRAGQALGVEVR